MNNKIQIKGNTNFMGVEVPNLEGGFGENQKVILAKTIAEVHNMNLGDINKIINNNVEEFEIGIDLLDLKQMVSNHLFLQNGLFTNAQWGNAKNIYLLSEQGYMLLVGFMKTKEIRKKLRREYFFMTGKTQKGDKVVYTVGLVKELMDNYLDSIKAYTEIQIGKKIA